MWQPRQSRPTAWPATPVTTGKGRESHVRCHLHQRHPGPALARPGCDRPGAADGGPGPDGDEHRAAVRAARAGFHHRGPAVGGHRLHPGVRQPAAARRQAGRPAGPQGHVPDRPGRLRRSVGCRRRLGQLHHADHRAGLPGRVRGAAGALGAVAADHHVHRAEGPQQGVRYLRGDRRGRRRDRPADRRRADRVPVLAVDAVCEPALRRGGVHRRSGAAEAAAVPGEAQARCPGRAAGLQRGVLPGLRLLQRGHAPLGHAVHLRVPGHWRGAPGGVRGLADPGRPPAAAARGWCWTATGAAPTSRCSSAPRGCSGSSCS